MRHRLTNAIRLLVAGRPARPVGARRSVGFRQWLLGVVRAPVRIHRYRDLHTRMVRDALCMLDCGKPSTSGEGGR